jgi:hypothetical protein
VPAGATLHDWVAVGTVGARGGTAPTTNCLPNGVAGSTFRFDWTFDDTVADSNGSSGVGLYHSISAWRMRYTSTTGMDDFSGSQGDQIVTNVTTSGGNDLFSILNAGGPSPSVVDCGTNDVLPQMALTANDENVFLSDAQPNVLFFSGDFTDLSMGVGMSTPGGTVLIAGEISDFYQLGSPQAPWLPYQMTTLPDGTVVWHFTTSPGTTCIGVAGCWFDPPPADGFVYQTDGNSRFTAITDFPTGFSQEFEVWSDGELVGTHGPGESVDFSGEPGGGVVEFTIRGIVPGVDPTDDLAFPLKLALDTAPASFTMTSLESQSVPSLGPTGLALLLLGLAGASAVALRARR